MSLLSVEDLSLEIGSKQLFNRISFDHNPGDKIALVGVNGCGKSSLLKLISQIHHQPHPNIRTQKGLTLTYLPQDNIINPNETILDHLFRSTTKTATLIRDYHHCLSELELSKSSALEQTLSELSTQMDLHHAWDYQARVASILTELNIHSLSQTMGTLSGGMVKKVRLAQALIEDTKLLILDEPTNHLDIATIEWLEQVLKRRRQSLLMVTHDRYFLNRLCNRILEIDQQSLYHYQGHYQDYLLQRAERYAAQERADQRLQSILRVELAWLKQGPKARSTKQKARKQRIDSLVQQKPLSKETALELGVSDRRLGKKVLVLKNATKSFGDKMVVNHFSYTFKQQERIGLVGPNGVGKTSLLNLINGRQQPDSGEIDCGVNTVFGTFDQTQVLLDHNKTIYEHVQEIGSQLILHDGTQISAAKLLERFLFPSSALKTPLGLLSGGEIRRLQLVCLLLKNPNFLLFDEPTNDLDITTLSVLEDFLIQFKGCLIVVSHDRYFMDRVVDQLLIFTENGRIHRFSGSYTDYLDTLNDVKRYQSSPKQVAKQAHTSSHIKTKLTNKERYEFQKLETDIEILETEKDRLTVLVTSQSLSSNEYERIGKQLKTIETKLSKDYARWEQLAEFA